MIMLGLVKLVQDKRHRSGRNGPMISRDGFWKCSPVTGVQFFLVNSATVTASAKHGEAYKKRSGFLSGDTKHYFRNRNSISIFIGHY